MSHSTQQPPSKKFLYAHDYGVSKRERIERYGHRPAILWFTGLSGSGKSTLANRVEEILFREYGVPTYVLDGDNIRQGLNKDLGFSPEDRTENIRRIGEVAKLFVDAGLFVLTAFISPYREDRQQVRNLVEAGEFIEVFVSCPLEVCEQRDVKGLYRRARAGEIPNFTGISAPYEEPENPEIIVETHKMDVEESARKIIDYLLENNYLSPKK